MVTLVDAETLYVNPTLFYFSHIELLLCILLGPNAYNYVMHNMSAVCNGCGYKSLTIEGEELVTALQTFQCILLL